MKKLRVLLYVACYSVAATKAEATPFSTQVNAMWQEGNKSGVLEIAQRRLRDDPDDLAGLILTVEHQMESLDLEHIDTSINRVVAVGARIITPRFSRAYPELRRSLMPLEYWPSDPAEQGRGGTATRSRSRTMGFLYALQAAELDGLIGRV